MVNKFMTLQQLYDMIGEEIKNGNGHKQCVITDDDEWNGFHPIYNGVHTMESLGVRSANEFRTHHLHGFDHNELYEECVIIG